jgi:hypothetical protein
MWLSFGWIPLVLMGIYIFFNSVITAFEGLPLEIALMSFDRWELSLQLLRDPRVILFYRPLL